MRFLKKKRRRPFLTPATAGIPQPNIMPVKRHKERRREGKKFLLVIFLVCITILGLGGILIVRLPVFAITMIEITDVVENDSLKADLENLKGKSVLLLNTKKTTQLLAQKYPEARYIAIEKRLPKTITVTVDARTPLATLIESGLEDSNEDPNASSSSAKRIVRRNTYYLDREGVPFVQMQNVQQEASDSVLPGLPNVFFVPDGTIVLGQKITNPVIARITEIVPEAQARALVFTQFSDPRLETATDSAKNGILANLAGDVTVIFSLEKPGAEQVVALQTILESTKIERSKIKKIDLRFIKPYVTIK